MRRLIAALTAAAALLAGAAVTPADPVGALRSVLAPGHGVRFTETAVLSGGAGERAEKRREGVFALDAEGAVKALDVTITGGEHGRERAIGFDGEIGGTGYRSGGLLAKYLGKGKTWWEEAHQSHLWHTELLGHDQQLVNPAEPATLAALLADGRRSGNTVTGVITFEKLERVSPWAADATHIGWDPDTRLAYTVTLNSAGLVSGVRSTFTFSGGLEELEGRTLHVDTRYRRWGGKVSIEPPDPGTTTTELCVEGRCGWRLPG
ncbi:hypothetical protein [Nonomuraea sp. NPDC048826]|uniref:hypothetical protein n=1 Tax=Nonomuraea sp. NPDC048826 TaxID=3364347 RepID=UPI003711996A